MGGRQACWTFAVDKPRTPQRDVLPERTSKEGQKPEQPRNKERKGVPGRLQITSVPFVSNASRPGRRSCSARVFRAKAGGIVVTTFHRSSHLCRSGRGRPSSGFCPDRLRAARTGQNGRSQWDSSQPFLQLARSAVDPRPHPPASSDGMIGQIVGRSEQDARIWVN
jgi:hypothetical protein